MRLLPSQHDAYPMPSDRHVAPGPGEDEEVVADPLGLDLHLRVVPLGEDRRGAEGDQGDGEEKRADAVHSLRHGA